MEVLLVTNSLRLGGFEMTVVNSANELRKRGHHAIIFSELGVLVSRLDAGVRSMEAGMQMRAPYKLWQSASLFLVEHERAHYRKLRGGYFKNASW